MFELIKNILMKSSAVNEDWSERPDGLQIAVCVVLLEVANADDVLTREDQAQIMQFFEQNAKLSETAAEELLNLAEHVRRQAVELWQFTHLISENFSVDDKLKLVETMWRIIYIDGRLETQEDYLIHKLSTLLGLRHSELIDVKVRVLEERKRSGPAVAADGNDSRQSET